MGGAFTSGIQRAPPLVVIVFEQYPESPKRFAHSGIEALSG